MKQLLLTLFSALFCLSCTNSKGQNTSQQESLVVKQDSTVVGDDDTSSDPWEVRDKPVNIPLLITYLKKAQQMRESLLVELKKSTPEQADQLYQSDGYKFYMTPEFGKVDSISMPVTMRSSGAFNDYPLTDEDKQVLKLLADQGLEPRYIGEGYSELITNPIYYYNIFEAYVTPETKEFVKIWADHDDIIMSDGGIIIPLDTLYARCLEWEKYLDKYPQSKHKESVVSQYGMYMENILFCIYDNTLTFDSRSHEIDPIILDEIKKLITDHPAETHTRTIVTTYLEDLKANNMKYSKKLENKIMNLWILQDYNER